jgi:hypothetical protein
MSKRSLAERVGPGISTPLTCAVEALCAGPAGDREQNPRGRPGLSWRLTTRKPRPVIGEKASA